MQLAITALGENQTHFINEALLAIRECNCHIQDLHASRLGLAGAAYLLVQGNWNQIAKLENMLDAMQKRLNIKVHTLRPEGKEKPKDCIPYSLETISLDRDNIIGAITQFLADRAIDIEDISGSCYQAPYIQSPVFSTKFIILIPPQLQLLTLREEFLDFCDQLNVDAILEPVKR